MLSYLTAEKFYSVCHAQQLAQPSSGAKSHSLHLRRVSTSVQDYYSQPKTQAQSQLGLAVNCAAAHLLCLPVEASEKEEAHSMALEHKPKSWNSSQESPSTFPGNLVRFAAQLNPCPVQKHWVGEPAWQISGTLEKKEDTPTPSTSKRLQLTLIQNGLYNLLLIFCQRPAQ